MQSFFKDWFRNFQRITYKVQKNWYRTGKANTEGGYLKPYVLYGDGELDLLCAIFQAAKKAYKKTVWYSHGFFLFLSQLDSSDHSTGF